MNKILFFGSLRELTGTQEMMLENISDTDNLLKELLHRFPQIRSCTFRTVINQETIAQNTPIRQGDEIALLPPFSGG
ncbi:MAG: MoaD/ThiS family protein [Cytophagaceae bacterium]